MDPSSALHHQEMSSQTLESMLVCTKTQQDEKKPKPQPEAALKCPRCDSTNTKFCYYNNYSLTQPRYFCKSCRRYWTKGGTLRNVPVGGGCRKNKRSSSSSSRKSQDQPLTSNPSHLISSLPSFSYDSSDLSLAFARLVHKQQNGHLGFDNNTHCDAQSSGTSTPVLFDALRGGFMEAPNNGFHNFYYNGNMGHLENAVNVCDQEMVMPYDQDVSGTAATTTATAVTVTTMKQEYGREGEGRVLWGFPWQIGGEGNNVGDVDHSGRESWNGLGSSWHGLLNSPLM